MVGSALFLFTLFVLKTDLRKLQAEAGLDSITNPLVNNEAIDQNNDETQANTTSERDNKAYSSNDETETKRKIN